MTDQTASTTDGAGAAGPLEGVLVADFSRILAGPYASMLLADLGADVVKVEGPGGDDTRTWLPPVRGGVATYYLAMNRNKRGIVLDFRDPEDRAAAQELARRADVVIENFKPGGLVKYGLDYQTVAATNPGVVYASISGFGTHEGASLPGYDLIVQAVSGMMSLTGDPDGPPYRAGISVFDVMSGLQAVIGILAALRHHEQGGPGQHVEVNLLATALSGMVNQASAWIAGNTNPVRMGNAHPSLFPYEPLPTADGDLIIAAGNDTQFTRLCHALDLPELLTDPRFAHNQDRTAHRDQLRPHLINRLATNTRAHWFKTLTNAGVACGPINTVAEGITLATNLGLDPIVTIGHGPQATPTIRNPLTLSHTPPHYHRPPPTLDQHGPEIRTWLKDPDAG